MWLKKVISISMILLLSLVASGICGCQNDTEIVFRNSARFLRKAEGAESRSSNPYAKTWRWGNQQSMPLN